MGAVDGERAATAEVPKSLDEAVNVTRACKEILPEIQRVQVRFWLRGFGDTIKASAHDQRPYCNGSSSEETYVVCSA